MIQTFRRLFQSPLGLAITLAFVGLIALAFASADITGLGFGGVAGGDRAATVGDQRIGTANLAQSVRNAYEQAREEQPGLTMEQFLAGGAVEGVLGQMIERNALYDFGTRHGIRIGESLIGSEISQIPAFQGADGTFSEQMFRAVLQQRGLSEQLVREDVAQGLVARTLLVPAGFGARASNEIASRYAALLKESRKGTLGLIPSAAFAEEGAVADEVLTRYYREQRERYMLPERRTVRYALLDPDSLEGTIAASDAEIAARYQENAEQYRARETRSFTQLIAPTEAAARAILEEVNEGGSLESVARAKGLSTSTLAAIGRERLSSQASASVARAGFDAARGTIAGPARGALGWHLLRVDAIERTEGRTLAQVRGELAAEIASEKRAAALADRAAAIEERIQNGETLAEIAQDLELTVRITPPVTEDGSVLGESAATLPEPVSPVLPAIFAMDENSDPQIAVAGSAGSYILYAVGDRIEAAPPPLAQIRERVTADYKLQQGAAEAKAAAARVVKAVAGGQSLAEAMRALDATVPPVETLDLTREEVLATGQRVPPPLALMFSMAEGTVKRLEAPNNAGWFIVALEDIVPGEVAADDPLLAQTRDELGRLASREYAEQLRRAIRAETEITRNDAAIAAVRDQLAGGQ